VTLGSITNITRYPVKSMRGETLDFANVDFVGLPLDRAFGFVKDGELGPFPWFTARDCPQMLECQPVLGGEGQWPEVRVMTPEGEFELASPEFREKLFAWSGRYATLRSDYRGCQDVAYASVISTATIRALTESAGVPNDQRRFRMNFVVELGDEPFAENVWVGKQVRLGGVTLAVHEPDRRCNMITLDPQSGASTPAVLKKAGELNGACAGVYCSVLVEGKVSVGDEVRFA
jgi:uncharacterized protein YcbX